MDFTREPIIETIITPRDGCKIVVRSSKTLGQEEHFVDAVEVISFGGTTFFRSQERPKAFLVPASDYEVLEVREARVVLKNVGLDRSIKIAGGKDSNMKSSKEEKPHKEEKREEKKQERQEVAEPVKEAASSESKVDPKATDSKNDGRGRRDRRRGRGRRRGELEETSSTEEGSIDSEGSSQDVNQNQENERPINPILSSLLTPPPTLISETLHRYRDNALFQSAFYTKEELDTAGSDLVSPDLSINQALHSAPPEAPHDSFYEQPLNEDDKSWEVAKSGTFQQASNASDEVKEVFSEVEVEVEVSALPEEVPATAQLDEVKEVVELEEDAPLKKEV